MVELASHATILVYALPPLTKAHVTENIDAIRNYKNNKEIQLITDQKSSTINGQYAWTISNKYYTAEVGLQVVEEAQLLVKGEEPAIIILASRDSIPSLLLKPLLNQLAARIPEFEIALLLSYPSNSASESSSIDEEAWEDLAMFNGFEWVDIASLEQKRSKEAEEEIGFGEETGVGRVVDALQAYLWEGMVQVPKATSNRDHMIQKERGIEDEEDECANLGAPPLPDPRPFVPTILEFPDTFLPSIPRKNIASTVVKPSALSSTSPITFEDDFSPFAPALSTSSFPSLPTASTSEIHNTTLTSDHVLSLAASSSTSSLPTLDLSNEDVVLGGLDEDPEETEGGEVEGDLENLLEKLMQFKKEQEGLGLDERRARVEELMKGMNIGEW